MPLSDILRSKLRNFNISNIVTNDENNSNDNFNDIEIMVKNSLPMDNNKQVLIDNLNQDLANEWSAAIQYWIHKNQLEGSEFFSIKDELGNHAYQEVNHADMVCEMIERLGGKICNHVGDIKICDDSRRMLQFDLSGEDKAISDYRERIQQAKELGEDTVVMMLTQILADEEEHKDDLESVLGE